MTVQPYLLDVSIVVSSGEVFAEKKSVNFLFRGNLKQLESYIYNVCHMYSFCLECVKSIVDVNTGKTLYRIGGLK